MSANLPEQPDEADDDPGDPELAAYLPEAFQVLLAQIDARIEQRFEQHFHPAPAIDTEVSRQLKDQGVADAGERLLGMAEREQAHRHVMNERGMALDEQHAGTEEVLAKGGLGLADRTSWGFIIVAVTLAAAVVILAATGQGQPAAWLGAALVGAGGLGGLMRIFLRSRPRRRGGEDES